MYQAKISLRIQREEFIPIPKDYTDFLVEKYPIKESVHVMELIRGKHAEADA